MKQVVFVFLILLICQVTPLNALNSNTSELSFVTNQSGSQTYSIIANQSSFETIFEKSIQLKELTEFRFFITSNITSKITVNAFLSSVELSSNDQPVTQLVSNQKIVPNTSPVSFYRLFGFEKMTVYFSSSSTATLKLVAEVINGGVGIMNTTISMDWTIGQFMKRGLNLNFKPNTTSTYVINGLNNLDANFSGSVLFQTKIMDAVLELPSELQSKTMSLEITLEYSLLNPQDTSLQVYFTINKFSVKKASETKNNTMNILFPNLKFINKLQFTVEAKNSPAIISIVSFGFTIQPEKKDQWSELLRSKGNSPMLGSFIILAIWGSYFMISKKRIRKEAERMKI